MPNITPIQLGFSAGEISPELYTRPETKGFNLGLKEMQNFIADPRGPARSRDGFRFLGKVFPGPDPNELVLKQIYWTGEPGGSKVFASEGGHVDYVEVKQFSGGLLWLSDNKLGQVAGLVGTTQCTVTSNAADWPLFDTPADALVGGAEGNFVWSSIIEKWLLICPNLDSQGVIVFSTTDFVDWTEEFRQPTGPKAVFSTTDSDGNIFVSANNGSIGTGYYSTWVQDPLLFTWTLTLTLITWDPLINSYFINAETNPAGDKWVVVGGRQQKWFSTSYIGSFGLAARSSISTDKVEFVKWGEDKFVLRQNRDPWLMYSTDGFTWNACVNNGTAFTDGNSPSGHTISFHPEERWVHAAGDNQWVSDDGVTWVDGPENLVQNGFTWGVLDFQGKP